MALHLRHFWIAITPICSLQMLGTVLKQTDADAARSQKSSLPVRVRPRAQAALATLSFLSLKCGKHLPFRLL